MQIYFDFTKLRSKWDVSYMFQLPKFPFHRGFHFLTVQYGSNDKNTLRIEIVCETNFRDFRKFWPTSRN